MEPVTLPSEGPLRTIDDYCARVAALELANFRLERQCEDLNEELRHALARERFACRRLAELRAAVSRKGSSDV